MTRHECLDILELSASASREEIVTAYRHLVQVWHPDRFPNNQGLQAKAHKKLVKVNEAYSILIDGRDTSFAPHRDEQVTYFGRDPRLKLPSDGISAIVEVSAEGLTLVTFTRNQADEVACYPRQSLVAAEVGLSRWIYRGATITWNPSDQCQADIAKLHFADPEQIAKSPIVVVLRLRNPYFAQLLLKRIQPSTDWKEWNPPPQPQPKPANTAEKQESSEPNGDETDDTTWVQALIFCGLFIVPFMAITFISAVGPELNDSETRSSASDQTSARTELRLSDDSAVAKPTVLFPTSSTAFDREVTDVAPTPAILTKSSHQTSAKMSVNQPVRPPLSKSPLHARITHSRDGNTIAGFVLVENLAPGDLRWKVGDTVQFLTDKTIFHSSSRVATGIIPKGEVGKVVRIKGNDVTVECEQRREWKEIRADPWHLRSPSLPIQISAGMRVKITANVSTTLLDANGTNVAELKDGLDVDVQSVGGK